MVKDRAMQLAGVRQEKAVEGFGNTGFVERKPMRICCKVLMFLLNYLVRIYDYVTSAHSQS